ncbi:MAG: esterase family protein [Planctomycetes bacterium]|nr:esterase family protein [Planctomycetota bacterium]
MTILSIERRSEVIGKASTVNVYINDRFKPPYPVVYLLHGLSDNHTAWLRNTTLEMTAEKYPFMIVMPDCVRSFYCDSGLGNYESYIVKDLVPYIDRIFPTRAERRYRATAGLSMGGYGAIKFGLKYPELFGTAAGHSSAVGFGHERIGDISDVSDIAVVCKTADKESNDPYLLAEKCPKAKRPNLYFDCGRDDFLYQSNESFKKHLTKIKFPHTYKRFSGVHNWEYWNEHIADSLAFIAKSMKVKTA